MKDTKIPKKIITIEFGSDEFLDSFHAMWNVIREERDLMHERHNRILDMFMQDIKLYKDEELLNKFKKQNNANSKAS